MSLAGAGTADNSAQINVLGVPQEWMVNPGTTTENVTVNPSTNLRGIEGVLNPGEFGTYGAGYNTFFGAVPGPDDTSLYGIDGLYRYGNSLIAIQNGIRPNRVVQLYLSDDGRSVERSRILAMNLEHFDEPNLGQVVGDEFFFIANSHWNRFDRDGNLPDDLEGPVVLKVKLGETP